VTAGSAPPLHWNRRRPIALPGARALVTFLDAGNYIIGLPTPVHTAVDWKALSKASSTSMRNLLQSGGKLTQTEWQLAPSIAARRCMRISVSWRAISTVNVVRALPNHLFVPPPSNIQSHRRRQ
jgi:hypothetical protein